MGADSPGIVGEGVETGWRASWMKVKSDSHRKVIQIAYPEGRRFKSAPRNHERHCRNAVAFARVPISFSSRVSYRALRLHLFRVAFVQAGHPPFSLTTEKFSYSLPLRWRPLRVHLPARS